jgi:glycosyltransferase involved in cell wall biosynthesis
MNGAPALTVFPMHGQHKLSSEGYRTRDGHLIEWFGKLLVDEGHVEVVSRPEPRALRALRSKASGGVAENTEPVTPLTWKMPHLLDRRRWWIDSLPSYASAVTHGDTPTVTWNPFIALSSAWSAVQSRNRPIVLDLLDDWTLHYAFSSVREEVERAYSILFERADFVTANAEGTAVLARRHGRSDVVLIPNGCDPDRFDPVSTATGPVTVGYVGKIGKRLNLEAILATARSLPNISFVFAGPILDREYRRPLADQHNIKLLGDVHYEDVPSLLRSFDIGWVPHNVGEGEVGGDVIKTYEYRAAGLPVLTTPVAGAQRRGLDAVHVVPIAGHAEWLANLPLVSGRVERVISALPESVRWETKARQILDMLHSTRSGTR